MNIKLFGQKLMAIDRNGVFFIRWRITSIYNHHVSSSNWYKVKDLPFNLRIIWREVTRIDRP
jgi:hypothetical protein